MNLSPSNLPTRPLRPVAVAGLALALAVGVGCDRDPVAMPSPAPSDGDGTSLFTVQHTAADHADGETCFIEDPSKRETGRLWCTEHARYEDRCWLCHPELEEEGRMWCVEHALYEDECHLCDPARGAASSAGPAASAAPLMCKEHRVPEAQCAICQPQRAAELAAGESMQVRMASAASAGLAGLGMQTPETANGGASLELLGEIRFDGNRRARVTPLASGVVTEVLVDVGERVEAGRPLAVLNAPGVAEAKAAYLSALASAEVAAAAHEREARLVEENISAKREAEAAEADHKLAGLERRKAEQTLLNLGFTEAEVAEVAETGSSSSSLTVRAPFAGTIVAREAVRGEAVEPGAPLFEVADLSTMWIELAVPEARAASLRPGTPVSARVEAVPGASFRGELVWLSPQVDEQTRMVRARASVPNDGRALRHGMFAEVTAELGERADAWTLPRGAVQDIDGASFVFVRSEPDLFDARRVETGPDAGEGRVFIASGITGADQVVTDGGFTMKTEFLKSRLGAGCVDD